jgi:hypothetical protein
VGIIGKIPAVISLSVTFGLIAGGVLVSRWKTRGSPLALRPHDAGNSAAAVDAGDGTGHSPAAAKPAMSLIFNTVSKNQVH